MSTCKVDAVKERIKAPKEVVFSVLKSINDYETKWYVKALFKIRFFVDKLLGGPGYRKTQLPQGEIKVGNKFNFSRVVSVETNKSLELQVEIKVPGKTILKFDIEEDGSESILQLSAIFYPSGFLGLCYWYSIYPFHYLIFNEEAKRIKIAAEKMSTLA